MLRMTLLLILGLVIGGVAGFFGGSAQTKKEADEALSKKTQAWAREIGVCMQDKTTLETAFKDLEVRFKEVESELKLNEARPGFVSSAVLSAPEFMPAETSLLKTNPKGDVLVKWSPVKGAKKYLVKIEDEAGSTVHVSEIEGETSVNVNFKTKSASNPKNKYYVRLVSINGLELEGPPGPRKPIEFALKKTVVTKKTPKKKRKKS